MQEQIGCQCNASHQSASPIDCDAEIRTLCNMYHRAACQDRRKLKQSQQMRSNSQEPAVTLPCPQRFVRKSKKPSTHPVETVTEPLPTLGHKSTFVDSYDVLLAKIMYPADLEEVVSIPSECSLNSCIEHEDPAI